jgi:hypothetical protein
LEDNSDHIQNQFNANMMLRGTNQAGEHQRSLIDTPHYRLNTLDLLFTSELSYFGSANSPQNGEKVLVLGFISSEST